MRADPSPDASTTPPARAGGHVPTRTCVGCRQSLPATALVRLVLRQGSVQMQMTVGSGGRGAWIHPSLACLTKAVKVKAFDRAFRVAVRSVDAETLARTLGMAR